MMMQAFAIRFFPVLTGLFGPHNAIRLARLAIRLGLPLRFATVRPR